jgi:DnaK suppressor protein
MDTTMNIESYKARLLELEKEISGRAQRQMGLGREQFIDSPADMGDASVADETASEAFTEAEQDSTVLTQVRDALTRIADGTFGKCIVDGRPIEAKRLEAVPWTPYCLKHQKLQEPASASNTPTL